MTKQKRPQTDWMTIISFDGSRRGSYQVSDGIVTVRFDGKEKSARASSTGVPASVGAKADEALARLLLAELAGPTGRSGPG
jgi:hypothetical protein